MAGKKGHGGKKGRSGRKPKLGMVHADAYEQIDANLDTIVSVLIEAANKGNVQVAQYLFDKRTGKAPISIDQRVKSEVVVDASRIHKAVQEASQAQQDFIDSRFGYNAHTEPELLEKGKTQIALLKEYSEDET